jgi:antitoxin (DNA-binding transcriptional repressor) of toxin-antitoxin stability system
MQKIRVVDVKAHPSELVQRAAAVEPACITHRGDVIAAPRAR